MKKQTKSRNRNSLKYSLKQKIGNRNNSSNNNINPSTRKTVKTATTKTTATISARISNINNTFSSRKLDGKIL